MMKKLGALALVLALALSLCAGAWASSAENMNGETGKIGEFQTADTPDAAKKTAVIIYKTIKAYNQSSSAVLAPTIDYEYTIAPGTAGAKVKDSNAQSIHLSGQSVEVMVKAGPAGATISGSADGSTFVDGKLQLAPTVELNTAAAGTDNKFQLKVDLSQVTFTGAGVYRYVITETTTVATKNGAGIAEGDTEKANIRYLDVYVKDAAASTAAEPVYEIYGYVLFSNLADIDAANESAAGKEEGFETDNYYTFDVTVSKTLVGDSAMNSHQFPFNVDFTNSSVSATIGLKQTTVAGGGITANLPANAAVSSLDVADLKLANGASVTYVGVPVGITEATQVDVYELNDVDGTIYRETSTVDGTAVSTAGTQLNWVDPSNKSEIATLQGLTMNAHDSASAHTIAFTNTLELISPTGVVLRVAPYVLILAAGLALLLVSRRRKAHTDEE